MSEGKEFAGHLARHPETRFLDAFYADLSGIVRGKRYPVGQAGKVFEGAVATPGSGFLLAVTGDSLDPKGMGFSDGDPDQLARPLPGTLRPVPWAAQPTAQVMLTFADNAGTPYYFEPRNVLARVIEGFAASGLRPVVAFELEFYLIDPEPGADGAPRPPRAPGTGQRPQSTQVYGMNELDEFAGFIGEVNDTLLAQGVPSQAITSEYAPGQFEINLQHVDDPLRAADDCVMFKRAVQGVARRQGFRATFMSKPYAGQSGSGMHLHISLLDAAGNNVLDGGGAPGSDASITPSMRHALGGILATLPEAMAILAPNVNAFRRFEPNIYVPVSRSWGFENRSTALRIPTGPGESRRLEHRVAGADANPYLVLAATLAGIRHGIEAQIDCGPPARGNAGAEVDDALPMRLRPALDRLGAGTVLGAALGSRYLDAYRACKLRELEAFERHVSPTEYAWYLLT